MGNLAMVITTRTQPGKRDEVEALYRKMLAPRAEANETQEVVVWAADQHDPDVFYLFEIYSDADAMGANAAAPWFGEYMGLVGPLLAGEPTVGMASPKWTKGV